jgi:membrane peptidoglycan carboxypeptidase
MERMTGGALPAHIWRAFMTAALEGEPVAPLDVTLEPDDRPPPRPASVADASADPGLSATARAELEALLDRVEEF